MQRMWNETRQQALDSSAGQAAGWWRLRPHMPAPVPVSAALAAALLAPKPDKPSAQVSLRASIAELLLLSKLRARILLGRCHVSAAASAEHRRQLDAEKAEKAEIHTRYAKILVVTCRDWFAEGARQCASHQRRL